ncbi:protein of unknown function [Tepidibacter aestuarii]|nr:protein of unknown function [Tepidibacter aestuarii]
MYAFSFFMLKGLYDFQIMDSIDKELNLQLFLSNGGRKDRWRYESVRSD